MAEDNKPRGLGRGLAALMGENTLDPVGTGEAAGAKKLPIEFLKPNPRNPRNSFDEDHLEELASSIREKGIIQPVLVRAVSKAADSYEIIAGERREPIPVG